MTPTPTGPGPAGTEIHPMTQPVFEWTGDLGDQTCKWNGFVAYANFFSGGYWESSVHRGNDVVFHSGARLIVPKNGTAARALCELVMEREWYKQSCQVLLDGMEVLGRKVGL